MEGLAAMRGEGMMWGVQTWWSLLCAVATINIVAWLAAGVLLRQGGER